jgi:hypothetical protein
MVFDVIDLDIIHVKMLLSPSFSYCTSTQENDNTFYCLLFLYVLCVVLDTGLCGIVFRPTNECHVVWQCVAIPW